MTIPRCALLALVLASGLAVACQGRPSPSSPALPDTGAAFSGAAGGAARGPGATIRQFAEEVFVHHVLPNHAGPGPHPTEESDQYSLMQGGIRWFASADDVTYWIRGIEPVSGGSNALEASVEVLDGPVTTRQFTRVVTDPSVNPCGDPAEPELGFNTLWWTAIDGPGGVLGSTAVCRNVATKEIVGFLVRIDRDETWSITGEAGKFDVLNIGVHELGHAAGLGHVNGSPGGCLTMYKFSAAGETQKRTLGLGDKLGLDFLYQSGDTTGGSCGS